MQTPKEASDEALQELSRFVTETFGAKTDLAAMLSKATGLNLARQHVQKWLHADPEKRKQPLFGMGLILLKVGAALMEARPEKRAQTIQNKKTNNKTKR